MGIGNMPKNVTTNMMDNLFNSDPTNFEEPPFHLITTDHPYMATLGLSTFTTGTLYRWVHEKDGQGQLANKKYFSFGLTNQLNPETGEAETDEDGNEVFVGLPFSVESILLGDTTADFGDEGSNEDKSSKIGKGQFAFEAWRKESEAGAGKYYTKYGDKNTLDPWNFVQGGLNEAGDPRAYNYDDLSLDNFTDKNVGLDGSNVDSFEVPNGKGEEEEVVFKGVKPITNIISLNNKMISRPVSISSEETKEDYARAEFLLDIQSSKYGYVEWSGYVPFQVSLAEGDDGNTFQCTKSDWVKYRLYLYSDSAPKSTRRGIAMAKPTFAGPPVDALGRKYQRKEDGRFAAFPEGSASSEVVADLDMTYNEYTGKWEAGSKQMVAVVVQQIEPAQVMSAERVRNLSPEAMLASPQDPNSHVIWGSGGAIPVSMQNANPMQWTPNYAQASELDEDGKFTTICPKQTDEKATLRIFNASSKALEVDQYVLLNQIDGLWFAIDFPSGVLGDDELQAGFDGLWEFSYCATNVVHYFRDADFKRVDYDDIEQGFHKDFYADDTLNSATYETARSLATGSRGLGRNAEGGNLLLRGGYHQFTSFDMMDNKIGGTRKNGNAYAVTNPLEGPNGEITDGEANGTTTGAFFGCIFPDGYNSEDIATYKIERDFVATPTVFRSGLTLGSDGNKRYTSTSPFAAVTSSKGDVDFQYFHDGGIDTGIKPFNDGPGRNKWLEFKDEEGNPVAMFNDGDNQLTNLPADIALNASPLGAKNGQPITGLHWIERLGYTSEDSADGIQEEARRNVKEVFTQGTNWMYRKIGDPADAVNQDFTTSSAFDFKPNRNNRIMFRPLKAEIYAQFGGMTYDENLDSDGQLPYRMTYGRQRFSQSFAEKSEDKYRPSSFLAHQRELGWDKLGFKVNFEDVLGDVHSIHNVYWGLQMNIDIPRSPTSDFLVSPKASLFYTNSRFHWNSWGREKQNQWGYTDFVGSEAYQLGLDYPWRNQQDPKSFDFNTSNDKDSYEGAGAVGIIGAVATCTANTNIRTNASCRLGMWSWSTFDNVQGGKYWPAWGKGNSYKDFNTTNLFVKVFHHWPREQTIYDPRYFAVHHFNAGILDETVSEEDDSYKIYTTNEDLTQKDPNDSSTKSYTYSIDQLKYEGLDLRVPCSKQKNPKDDETNLPNRLYSGSRMYGTSSFDGEATYTDTTYSFVTFNINETLEKTKWNVDPKRRGKLLPYNYEYRTVRIPLFAVYLPDYTKEIYENGGYAIVNKNSVTLEYGGLRYLDTQNKPFYNTEGEYRTFDPLANLETEDVLMIVKNPGKGYAEGDTFVTPLTLGSPAEIKVTKVDDEGRIERFHVSIAGYDFGNTGFTNVDEDSPISRSSTGMSLANGGNQKTEKGSGFQAYIVRGEVQNATATDEKPKFATRAEFHRLSIKSNSDAIQEGQGATPFGLEEGVEIQDIVIDTPSSGSKYDLFFHFHNDVSHTFMLNDWKGSTDRWNNDEQYIDIEITTN